uniref:Uncharacterized protein n=1 Tax=Rangifer tarandus platyrhynchus TaxID=3082113 RepID=A0ACB0FCG1_RANTA|nr:unnamed protein product [Rangifer tarandus platyrhynchus]
MSHAQLSLAQAWPTSPRGPSQGHRRAPGAPATGDGRRPGGGPGRRTHRRGGRARRGCPCPRRRGWVRRPLARAERGARLRARAAGSAVQSARACRLARRAARPGSRLPGGASRRAPPERLPGASQPSDSESAGGDFAYWKINPVVGLLDLKAEVLKWCLIKIIAVVAAV